MGDLTKSAINIADQAVSHVTAANVQHSDRILTHMGEYVVKDKAEDVARELAYVLKGKKTDDYAKLRRDPRAQGHRHPVDLHPGRSRGIHGFI